MYSTAVLIILAKIVCPETVAFFRGSKYIFKCNVGNWFTSEDNCNASGGQLTSIETSDENTFLVDAIALILSTKDKTDRKRGLYWIGLTYNNDEMSYKWLSGEPLNYNNWYQGQPDNSNFLGTRAAHCAMIDRFNSFEWGDEDCYQTFKSVCEIR
ncbi:CD206 [Mytilus edulis]|uniref:MRC n=1 Tax=Mytilus edulis TaxID=6550 RepID=A0A8S3SW77_MYTED|nr:CD206 [Mytilus edulis]